MRNHLKIVIAFIFLCTAVLISQYADAELAKVISTEGKASVLPEGTTSWVNAAAGMSLKKGDRVKTSAGARCVRR